MLAKKVRVNVYGELSDGLYSGYANGENMSNTSAYIISRKRIYEFLRGVVIAVVTLQNGEQRCVVAPEGEIFYEFEIMEKLNSLRNVKIKSINCLYENPAARLLFTKLTKRTTRFCLSKTTTADTGVFLRVI